MTPYLSFGVRSISRTRNIQSIPKTHLLYRYEKTKTKTKIGKIPIQYDLF